MTTVKEKVQHYVESVKQNVTFHSNPIRNKQTSCYVEKHPSANYQGKQMSQKKLHFFFKMYLPTVYKINTRGCIILDLNSKNKPHTYISFFFQYQNLHLMSPFWLCFMFHFSKFYIHPYSSTNTKHRRRKNTSSK